MFSRKCIVVCLAYLLALCFPHNVSSTGAYMSAFLRLNNFTGTSGTKQTHDLLQTYPKLSQGELKEADEKFSLCNGIDVRELTISQVQELFHTKQLSSVELTNCYLLRIHHMNEALRAVIQVNPNAVNEAYKADRERVMSNGIRSLLHGIPVLIKDSIATIPDLKTTSGSRALLGLQPKENADVVKALKKAGAIILGKTNLSELSGLRGVNGWSGRGGQTRNPYNLLGNPYGSSTGSAVAVASNLAMGAIGGETDGSIISPASVAGIFGLKPTLGLISTKKSIPISKHQDCVRPITFAVIGPMARTTLDLAIVLDAMTTATKRATLACGGSYALCLLQENGPYNVGLMGYPYWSAEAIPSEELHDQLPVLEALIGTMRTASYFTIQEQVSYELPLLKKVSGFNELTVLLHDLKHELNEYLQNELIHNEDSPLSLHDIIEFNSHNPDGYSQKLLMDAELTDGVNNKTYLVALQTNQKSSRELLTRIMTAYKLDALLFPNPLSPTGAVVTINESDLYDAPALGYQLAAIAGFPSINVPIGIDKNGIPFGATFVGMPNTEATLLQISNSVEAIHKARKRPDFLP